MFSIGKKTKINKLWESYHNIHLECQILVKNMELQRRHLIVLKPKISYLEGLKFHRYIKIKVIHQDTL